MLEFLFPETAALTRLDRIEAKLDRLLAKAEHMEVTMTGDLDALSAQVAETTDVEKSAIVLIEGIAAKLAEAGTDPAKLTALQGELHASSAALAAAVTANTPPAPPPA